MKKIYFFAFALLLSACSTPNQKPDSAGTPISSVSSTPANQGSKISLGTSLTNLETDLPTKFSQISKPVVVTFWASWCTTCRQEFALWRDQALAQNVIGINVQDAIGSSKLRADAYNLMKSNGTVFPSYVDTDDVLTSQLGIVGLPVTIVVANDGRILARHDGVLSKKAMLHFIALTKN